jgi:hypothetical protein
MGVNALVGQSGGPTSAINATLSGIIKQASISENIDILYGMQNGIEGFLKEQIIDLIKTGSLDAFLDCLDFAPVGVIDLLKKFAVSVPLADYEKRQALKEKTGFDVDIALKNMIADKAEDTTSSIVSTTTRRVQSEAATSGRRTAAPKYNVVKKGE